MGSHSKDVTDAPVVTVPIEGRSRVYFIDEAGAKGSGGEHFVVAGVQCNDPDLLTRAIEATRDRHRRGGSYTDPHPELKFREVTKASLALMKDCFDAAVATGARFGVFVVDKSSFNPWHEKSGWEGNLFATERLVRGMVTRRELAVVLIDQLAVPADVSYGELLRSRINERFHCMRIAAAVSIDSRASDGLQIADMVAGAAYYYRKKVRSDADLRSYLMDQTPKACLSRHVAEALGIGVFDDVESEVVSIVTSHPSHQAELPLAISGA